jgi:tetratricopeptide (TPR) repeat protein
MKVTKTQKIYMLIGLAMFIFGFLAINLYQSSKRTEKINLVQQAIQEEDTSCGDDNKQGLREIHDATNDDNNRGLYAEQLATCYSVEKNYDQAINWYDKAKNSYEKSGEQQKVENMTMAVQNSTNLRDTNPVIEAEDSESEGQ